MKKEKEEDIHTNLFLELASSLNVELVYVILKSITQFAYTGAGNKKKAVENIVIDKVTGDATL